MDINKVYILDVRCSKEDTSLETETRYTTAYLDEIDALNAERDFILSALREYQSCNIVLLEDNTQSRGDCTWCSIRKYQVTGKYKMVISFMEVPVCGVRGSQYIESSLNLS